MADKEEKKEEVKKPEGYDYKKNTNRSFKQIASEEKRKQKKEVKNADTEEPKPEPEQPKDDKKEEPKEEKPVSEKPREETPKIDPDEIARKATEAAEKKAEERIEATKKEFQGKIDEILNKEKTDIEKQKDADELIAIWQKENRLPKDYQELINESLRIADVRYQQRERDRLAQEKAQREEQEKQTREQEETKKANDKKQFDDFTNQVTQDVQELIRIGELKAPKDINEINNPDTKDANAKAIQKVFEFGVKLNLDLVKEGKEPVRSLYKIYYSHYKPTVAKEEPKDDQPAGADAPVAGARNTPSAQGNGKLGVPMKQLRNETWGQTIARLKRDVQKKITNRG